MANEYSFLFTRRQTMWGRQDPDNERLRRSFKEYPAGVNGNGTGKKRGIPQRPPNMARIGQPPTTQRVGRPQREASRPGNWRRRLVIWGVIFVVCSLLACGIGYAAVNFFAATNANAGAATTTTNFLAALSNQNYNQAYNDLDATITVQTSQEDFRQEAQNDDRCYGPVTNYSEVANSAVQNSPQSYTYSFNITRSKLPHPYALSMTLQQDSTTGHWQISSYGNNNDLGPGQPPCN